MRLLLCCIILINICRDAILGYVCHVYSQNLDLLRYPGTDMIPKSVVLANSCSFCFGIIHFNLFINGCRRNGLQESKTLHEFFGVMCSRNPNYCGYNFCCCASTDCFNKLRYHFLRAALSSKKDVSCVVYRQRWIENNRSKRLNESFSPTSEQLYKRSDCTACVALVDAEGVEMTCSKEDIRNACRGMDLFVGGPVVCNKNGDCCCQGEDCSEALRNFYSGYQKALGTPRMFAALSGDHCHYFNLIVIFTSLSVIVLLDSLFHLQLYCNASLL